MQLNNIHIIVFLIIIIIVVFIYNYDIHVTVKGKKLCNDVLIDKKKISETINQNELTIIDTKENNVINNVMKVLENIPTEINQNTIQSTVYKLNLLYQNSKNIDEFNNKLKEVSNEYPYNTKYAKLVSNLIIKFDDEIDKKQIDDATNIVSNIDPKNVKNFNILKKSKKKNQNKKVSFDESQNSSYIVKKNDNKNETPIINVPETFNNIGEFNNYAPF